jgi:P2 family phage contractile tail tube protein
MLKNVRCNVEDYRVFHDGVRVEDVTKADLPTIQKTTTQVKAAGMLMDVDMPNWFHYEAMELGLSHNNGNNCSRLKMPGPHNIELRAARQNYSVTGGEMDLELVKVRARVVHKSAENGSVETGNPLGTDEKFSVLRYEEEMNGEIVTLIDSTAGRLILDGVDYSDRMNNILD